MVQSEDHWRAGSRNSAIPPDVVGDVMNQEEEDRLVEEHMRLAEVLRDLHDLQNGPPLPGYEQEWDEVMKRAVAILKQVERRYL